MSLEEYIPDIDSSEWWWQTAETTKEVSEKFKESIKRSSSGVKRTQKDEKKAKKHDILLAGFLVKIIIDKKFDPLLESLFQALDNGYGSNLLLGVLSLVHKDISDDIRSYSQKPCVAFKYTSPENTNFNDHDIPEEVKQRINAWIEDIIDISTLEVSHIQTQKMLNAFSQSDIITWFMSKVFSFFINSINMSITPHKSQNICVFIMQQIEKELKKIRIKEI